MTKSTSRPRVVISSNGPYLVSGDVPLAKQTIVTDREGESQQWRQGDAFPAQDSYQLCRCGKSKTKPFCDGTHEKIGFDGTETAPRTTYREQAQVLEGPALALTDAQRAAVRRRTDSRNPGRARTSKGKCGNSPDWRSRNMLDRPVTGEI